MTKRCIDCRLVSLITDPSGEYQSVYYCQEHKILLSPVKLNGSTCPEAKFAGTKAKAKIKAA